MDRYICYLHSPPTEYCGDIDVIQSHSHRLEELFSSREKNNGIYLLFKKEAYFNLLRLKHDDEQQHLPQQHLSASYGLSHLLYVGIYTTGFAERMTNYEKDLNGKNYKLAKFNPAFAKVEQDDLICITLPIADALTPADVTETETAIMCLAIMFSKWKEERIYNRNFSNQATKITFCNDEKARTEAFVIFNHILQMANEACIFSKNSFHDVWVVEVDRLTQSNFSALVNLERVKPSLKMDWSQKRAIEIVKKNLPQEEATAEHPTTIINARLHSCRTLLLCADYSMSDLENKLKAKRPEKASNKTPKETEAEINLHFQNPPKFHYQNQSYDWSVGNFPLTQYTVEHFMRLIYNSHDFSVASVGDVTVVFERKFHYKGATNDFIAAAFRKQYPFDLHWLSLDGKYLWLGQNHGFITWPPARGSGHAKLQFLIPLQGRLVFSDINGFEFKVQRRIAAVQPGAIKYIAEEKKKGKRVFAAVDGDKDVQIGPTIVDIDLTGDDEVDGDNDVQIEPMNDNIDLTGDVENGLNLAVAKNNTGADDAVDVNDDVVADADADSDDGK